MKGKKDQFEYMITEDFEQLAKEEEEEILKDDSIQMPEGFKESLRAKLEEQIKEKEREELYSKLSEEDRLALEVGRKVLEEEKNKEVEIEVTRKKKRRKLYITLAASLALEVGRKVLEEEKNKEVTRKKKRRKLYLTLAASLVLVMAISVTSIGVPGRAVTLVKQAIGDREVEKINSSDENLTIVEENEEKAYQVVSEEFGTELARIYNGPEDMTFQRMEFDPAMQMADFIYYLKNETVVYCINASYKNASWGMDVEDEVTEQYEQQINGNNIEIKKYKTPKTNTERYSARFEYNGLEYFLIGTMTEDEFNLIINNLFFLK